MHIEYVSLSLYSNVVHSMVEILVTACNKFVHPGRIETYVTLA